MKDRLIVYGMAAVIGVVLFAVVVALQGFLDALRIKAALWWLS